MITTEMQEILRRIEDEMKAQNVRLAAIERQLEDAGLTRRGIDTR
jgi:hypothetical protein